MIGMQDEDRVQRLGQHRIDLVLLGRDREAHAQEILGVAQLVRADTRRAGRCEYLNAIAAMVGILAIRRWLAISRCMRIVDVGGVVIEGRQRADHAAHHRHRVRVAAEAAEERGQLLVHHRVVA